MAGDRVLSYRALTPAWVVFVGVVAMWSPPPTVAVGVLLLVITVVVIPAMMVAAFVSRQPRVALATVEVVALNARRARAGRATEHPR